jgi:hypothetical protein
MGDDVRAIGEKTYISIGEAKLVLVERIFRGRVQTATWTCSVCQDRHAWTGSKFCSECGARFIGIEKQEVLVT